MNIVKIKTILRTSDWWNHIIPPILGFYCLGVLAGGAPYNTGLQMINVLFLMFFIAVFGFVLGEWSDRADDAAAGKVNRLSAVAAPKVFGLLSGSLLLIAVFSWLIGFSAWHWTLLACQLLAFVLYSLPPFRWKRWPYAAAALDSIYSGTLMYVLAVGLHLELSVWVFLPLGFWGLLRGARNYFVHTVLDAANDRKRGIVTPAILHGTDVLKGYMLRLMLPLEVLAMLVFLLVLPYDHSWVFALLYAVSLLIGWQHRTAQPELQGFGILVSANLFHELVLLMAALLLMVWQSPVWGVGVFAVLLLFDGYRKWFWALWNKIRPAD